MSESEFVKMYVELARRYNLSTKLSPPEALYEKADEYERFLSVVFSNTLTEFFEGEIRFLRSLAREMEAAQLKAENEAVSEIGGSDDVARVG